MQMRVSDTPTADAAHWMAGLLSQVIAKLGQARIAVSGGSTALPLFEALVHHEIAWDQITVWQVDERIAPDGHEDRNARQLEVLPCRALPMPVTAEDLDGAAAEYARQLPERFDLIHLGLGPDGHTASWPPGNQRVIESARGVEVTEQFNGYRRMTLTPLVVNAARHRVMLTMGADRAPLIRAWADGETSIPVGFVERSDTVCFLDRAAAGRAGRTG
jgi:6-phosphogluconolactonase/glucosamine-6-phosphate isomerase/deaminase